MLDKLKRVQEIDASRLDALPAEVSSTPLVLRGAVASLPLVREARKSDEAAVVYLARFYNGRPVSALVAPPSEQGRFFYRPDAKAMNFETASTLLPDILQSLLEERDSDNPATIAMQAISAPDVLPGLEAENPNPFVPAGSQARIWIGNRVTVAPHFDVAENLACVAAGRRRFTLFPPEQTINLYPGPMDVTPANVPVSMVAMDDSEFDRFPRYRQALAAAEVAELGPGDAIYIPYLWWHGVESQSRFNVLVNYWFNRDAAAARYPFVPLLHLIFRSYQDMQPEHRSAWRALYDHYVFESGGDPMKALSPPHRESGCSMDAARLRQLLRELLG